MAKKNVTFIFFFCLTAIYTLKASDGLAKQSVTLGLSTQEEISALIDESRLYAYSDITLSLQYAQIAAIKAENMDEPELKYKAFKNLGYVAFNAGLFEVAIQNYFRVLPIAEDMNDLKKISTANYMVGVIRLVLEDYDTAERYLHLGMQQIEKATPKNQQIDSGMLLKFANNLGVVYLGRNQLSNAEEAISNGLKLAEEHGRDETIVRIQLLHNLADTYHRQGRHMEAVATLEQADRLLADQKGLTLLKSMVHLLWGKVLQKRDEPDYALSHYHVAYQLARSANGASHIKHSAERLSDFYKTVNQPDSVVYYANISKEYENKQRLRQAGEELARIELLSQFRQTEAQLSREYQQSVQFYLILALGFLVITIVVYVLYVKSKKRYSHTRKESETLLQRFEEVELEKDRLRQQIVVKEKVETLRSLQMIQSKEKVDEMIDTISNNGNQSNHMVRELKKYLSELNSLDKDEMWTEFEVRFKGVFGNFAERLNQVYPTLTANELRLCAFIKMDMTTKEIVAVTGQSIRAVETARTRLRKKLELTGTKVNLNQHIQQI